MKPKEIKRQAGLLWSQDAAALQLKIAATVSNRPSAQSPKRPVAPAAFRPTASPKAVQPKTPNNAINRKSPVAPPAYRPQPMPAALQGKSTAPHLRPNMPRALQKPLRSSPVAQPKRAAILNQPVAIRPALPNAQSRGVLQRSVNNARFSAIQLGRGKKTLDQAKQDKTTKRKKEFKKNPLTDKEQSKQKREQRALALRKRKRDESLEKRRQIVFARSTHTMKLRYPKRDNVKKPSLDEGVVQKYVLLALDNFVNIVAAAGKFVTKTQVVKAKRLDNLSYGVNAKFATKKNSFPLRNCVAISERQDGVVIVSANQKIPPKARKQLDLMFPKGFILLEPKTFRLTGLHCEIKLWEEVDDFETTPFGVQQLCCLYCAAQLVAVGVTNFAGCHGQTYAHTNISTVIVGQPDACKRLLGSKVYAWYKELKTDEQYQFISALEGGGGLQMQLNIRPKKLGTVKYSEESKKIHDTTGRKPMKLRKYFDKDDDYVTDKLEDILFDDPDVFWEEDLSNITDVPLPPLGWTSTPVYTGVKKVGKFKLKFTTNEDNNNNSNF